MSTMSLTHAAGMAEKTAKQTIQQRTAKGRQPSQKKGMPQRPRRAIVSPSRDKSSLSGLATAAITVEEVDTRSFCNTKEKERAPESAAAAAAAAAAAEDGKTLTRYNLLSGEASVNAFWSELRRRELAEREGSCNALTEESVRDAFYNGYDAHTLSSESLSTISQPSELGSETRFSFTITPGAWSDTSTEEDSESSSTEISTEKSLGSFALSSTVVHASEKEVEHFLRTELCIPKADLRRARQRGLYRYSIDQLRSIIDILQDFGMSKSDAVGAVDKSTVVFTLSAKELRHRLTILLKLGLRRNSVSRLVHTFPKVLLLSPPTLKKRAAFMIKHFGIKPNELGKVINKYSQVLCMSKNSLLKRAVYLQEEAGIAEENLARVIVVHPRILSYSWEKVLRPKIQFFTSLGLTKPQIRDLICKTPSVVSLSVEKNLKPKTEYFFKNLGGDIDLLLTYSAFLTLSLEKRIVPRHNYMLLLNHASTAERIHSFYSTDAEFARSLGTSLQDYQDFVKQSSGSA